MLCGPLALSGPQTSNQSPKGVEFARLYPELQARLGLAVHTGIWERQPLGPQEDGVPGG